MPRRRTVRRLQADRSRRHAVRARARPRDPAARLERRDPRRGDPARLGLEWCTQLSRISGIDGLADLAVGIPGTRVDRPVHGEARRPLRRAAPGRRRGLDRTRTRLMPRRIGFRFGYQVTSTEGDRRRCAPRRGEPRRPASTSCTRPITSGTGWPPLALLLAMADDDHTDSRRHARAQQRLSPSGTPRSRGGGDRPLQRRTGRAGLGAGHTFTEYRRRSECSSTRPQFARNGLAESVEILRRAARRGGGRPSPAAITSSTARARCRARQQRLPILVGVNGIPALTHAARHADIIGLTMLGRTLDDGQRHEARWEPDRIDATVAHIRDATATPQAPLELNALIQAVDRHRRSRAAPRRSWSPSDRRAHGRRRARAPFLAIGTHARSPITCWRAGSAGGSRTSACGTSTRSPRSSRTSERRPPRSMRLRPTRCVVRRIVVDRIVDSTSAFTRSSVVRMPLRLVPAPRPTEQRPVQAQRRRVRQLERLRHVGAVALGSSR